MMEIEAGRDRAQVDEGPHQQRRGDNQGERQRKLQHDQAAAQPRAARTCRRGSSPLAKRAGRPRSSDVEDRRQAREHRRSDAHGHGKQQQPPVQADVERDGPPELRKERHGEPSQPDGNEQPKRQSGRSEQQRLDEQQPADACPAGSKRGPHRDFTSAIRRAREQQVRDVRAGDEQHQQRRAEQQLQR